MKVVANVGFCAPGWSDGCLRGCPEFHEVTASGKGEDERFLIDPAYSCPLLRGAYVGCAETCQLESYAEHWIVLENSYQLTCMAAEGLSCFDFSNEGWCGGVCEAMSGMDEYAGYLGHLEFMCD